jgi:ABC-type glycerol-3-phosphate transport system permease component
MVPPSLIPVKPNLSAYVNLWKTHNFGIYYLNSVIIASFTMVLCMAIANLAGFGFSRYNFKFKTILLIGILLSQMIPGVLFVIPYFIMMGKMGLINTKIALIIAHISFSLPFSTWMLLGYYKTIPISIDEAGKIDGCNRFQVFLRIVLPLSIPGNIATLIFSFMQSWNEYLFSLSLVTKSKYYTVPVGIALFMGEYRTSWNELMAGAVVASFPIIIIYICVDKYLVNGLVAGSLKQ